MNTMKKSTAVLAGIGLLVYLLTVPEEDGGEGYFIARSECPAYKSLRKKTNPGNVVTRKNHSYPILAKNKADATHYLVRMDAKPPARWVDVRCGQIMKAEDESENLLIGEETSRFKDGEYVLAINWQPGFCETRPYLSECVNQTKDRYDTSHFSLHGLWPEPPENVYCRVSPDMIAKDKNHRWSELNELMLGAETRKRLNRVMPGTRSFLHRHEWIKHGTCYNGGSAEAYFQDSLDLMTALNGETSKIRTLFVNNIGRKITSSQIAAAFDHQFGQGAGEKIRISCKQDGHRRLITEITIRLKGDLSRLSMGDALMHSRKAGDIGCREGIVDPVGLQ